MRRVALRLPVPRGLEAAQALLERAREDSGQAVVLAALIVMLCGAGAITVDIGLLAHERLAIQNTVEAGALAELSRLPALLLAVSLAGGVVALAVLVVRGRRAATMPYAPAIAAGVAWLLLATR